MAWRLVLCVLLTYSNVQHVTTLSPTTPSPHMINPACNGTGLTLTRTADWISFPSFFSRTFPANADCRWHIQAPEGQHVQSTLSWVNIQDSIGCNAASLNIYHGSGTNSPLLGSWCGQITNTILVQSTSNHQLIHFTSDNSSMWTHPVGFGIYYKTGSAPCDGLAMKLTAEGYITSPNYPNNYPNNAKCEWQIYAPDGKIIVLEFVDFDLESYNCDYDSVILKYLHSSVKLCGDTPHTEPRPFPSNKLTIKFTSDASVVHKGFKIRNLFMDAPPGKCDGSVVTLTYPAGISTRDFPVNATCAWLIKAPLNKMIKLWHNGYGGRCSLKVYDGQGQSAPLLIDLCEMSYPKPVIPPSTSNYLFVQFTLSEKSYYSDLRIWYTFINLPSDACHGNVVNLKSEGVITSPGYRDQYPRNVSCRWQIEAPAHKNIQLDLESLYLGYSVSCQHGSHLKVYNGQNTSAPLLTTLCGRLLPAIPISTSNFLLLKFISKLDPGTGFKLKFRFLDLTGDEPCQREVIKHTSPVTITSPNYPGKYPTNVTCEWEIKAPVGERIHLQSKAFDFGHGFSDYVNIYEGSSKNAPLLASAYGRIPKNEGLLTSANGLTSRSNILFVQFKANKWRRREGFEFNFTFVKHPAEINDSAPCDGTPVWLTSPGQISEESDPSRVIHFQPCKWEIQAPFGMRIQLIFIILKIYGYGTVCRESGLKVYDGPWPYPSLLTNLPGHYTPSPLTSTTNFLLLQLSYCSNWYPRGPILQLNFTFTNAPVFNGFSICNSTNLLTSDSENIVTPRDIGGDFYPRNITCTLRVKAPRGKIVALAVEGGKFKLDSSTNCINDYLAIYNGNGGMKIGRFCGTIFPKSGIKSTGDELLLIFHSNDVLSRFPGFNLSVSFISSEPTCGDALTGNTGVLKSPNFPNNYNNYAHCRWTITVAENQTVVLEFDDFTLEYDPLYLSCRYDSVDVYDGLTNSNTRLGKFCGNTISAGFRSTGRYLLVEFTSDASVVDRGFQAKFTAITPESGCGGAITDETGQLQSPGFNHRYYPNNANCIWNITVAENKIVQLEFVTFVLQYDYGCLSDAVAVYDGPTNSTRLVRFCGSRMPPVFRSSGRHLLVQFYSDNSVVHRGFQASFTATIPVIADIACGKKLPAILTESAGHITSPGWQIGSYPDNSFCQWRVQVTNGMYIQLQVNSFSLESGWSYCNYDYLEVYNGPDNTSPKLGRYCGSSIDPPDFNSTGSTIFVQFESDSSVTRRGFNLTYSTAVPEQ